jgi:hypothetical protein
MRWRFVRLGSLAVLLVCGALLSQHALEALGNGPVAVRHREGLVHGFLALSTLDGTRVADGDLFQNATGDRVTIRLVFRFKNGSVREETTVFSQRQRFQLLTYRLVQKGPTFPQALDMSIDATRGQVSVRYTDEGEPKVSAEHMDLPPNLANGIIVVKVEVGGIAGLLAPILGKQPPDSHVWILGGDAPAFVKSEGPMFLGGPIWRVELVSPVWKRLT